MSDRIFNSLVATGTLVGFSVGQAVGRWLYIWVTSR